MRCKGILVLLIGLAGVANSQSFLELQNSLRSPADLNRIIRAAEADGDSTKMFFGLLKLGSFYLDLKDITRCDSTLAIIETRFTRQISNNIKWGTLNVSDYYQLLSYYYYQKNDLEKSKLFLEAAQRVDADVFSYTNNLYRVFVKEGKLDSAELYLQYTFPALAKKLDINNLDLELLEKFDLNFRNMCHIKFMQGDLEGFRHYLSKWIPLSVNLLDNPARIKPKKLVEADSWKLIYLSKYLTVKGHYKEAKDILNRVKVSSLNDESKLDYLRTRSQFYYAQNKMDSAVMFLTQTLDLHRENIVKLFPMFTEVERENYVAELNDDYDVMLSLVTENTARNEQLLREVFEFQLFRKGLLLDVTKKLNKAADGLKDAGAIDLQRHINNVNDSISRLTFKTTNIDPREKMRLLHRLNTRKEFYEKSLLRLISNQTQGIFTEIKADEITRAMPDESCLIEIIRFKKWSKDPKRILSPNHVEYAILIIPQQGEMNLIVLPNGEELEGRMAKLYKNTIQFQVPEPRLYEVYWADVFKVVKDYKTIFLSPDGIYNIININTLQRAADASYVLDHMNLINLTSPKDLLNRYADDDSDNEVLLIGYPQYAAVQGESRQASFRGSVIEDLEGIKKTEFATLPGTLQEIETIDEIIREKNGTTVVLKGTDASETNLKSTTIPEILHMATHGFFIGLENKLVNPLLKSGLVLAGVNSTGANDRDDGVLTALEIASLDLSRTKLVVLSACETGLGEVKNGDGVYGLQRAFKLAEARFIILSMWKVDDKATMELMSLFYSTLVSTNDVVLSFKTAQKKLREDYPDPFYWGAFKLFGY